MPREDCHITITPRHGSLCGKHRQVQRYSFFFLNVSSRAHIGLVFELVLVTVMQE